MLFACSVGLKMTRIRSLLPVLLAILFVSGCASTGSTAASQGLVGAWLASASRAGGQGSGVHLHRDGHQSEGDSPRLGVVLLTFSSDGTFFRSGDTHPILSVAHGTWKQISDRQYDATYVALRFNDAKKFIGTQQTRIRITQGPTDNEFSGLAKVRVLDASGKEERTSETKLAGKRIVVEPF